MTHESPDRSDELAEFASVGQAGEPTHADAAEREVGVAPPTQEQLDEREERVSRPRKPMGPEPTGIPESVPDEP